MSAAPDDWTISPITGVFGAELTGAQVRDGIDGEWLMGVLEAHLVVVLRDQYLSHAEQVALARALGEPTPAHPVVPGHPDFPEILELDGANGGRNARWRTTERRMRRVTLRGATPFGPTGTKSHVPNDPLVTTR